MSKLILTKMDINGRPCRISALEEDGRVVELRPEYEQQKSCLGNIYIGKVENIAQNMQAAFVQLQPGIRGYFPLAEQSQLIYAAGRNGKAHLRPGDEILIQVSRDAMKGKLPALSANLNFTGKYLVLTTGNRKFGFSKKLSEADRTRLSGWFEEEQAKAGREYGVIVRTNAAEAKKEELLHEFSYLKSLYKKVAVDGRSRTCYSLLYETEPMYLRMLQDCYIASLEEILTDDPKMYGRILAYLQENSPQEAAKLRLYEDALLPIYKLFRIETALDEVRHERIWLKSGGFLVIQQTEAFVSIDVNSGKYTEKKKAEEAYRKINLEAAGEIARQLRLRNLSGIILIDFINMKNPDHVEELFHVLKKRLKQDPIPCNAVDITPLNIFEMTRKKVRRPVIEDLLMGPVSENEIE